MRWSKLKQTIESKFSDNVSGRVELFSTAYRKPNSGSGRGWITIDKVEIVNFATIKSWWNFGAYYHEATKTDYLKHPAVEADQRSIKLLAEEGEFSRFDLHNCCWEYLNLTIEQALEHDSPVINSLAVLDKRLGKRRIAVIDRNNLHPLTRKLLEFRLSVENLT